jgi:hypothetical protein
MPVTKTQIKDKMQDIMNLSDDNVLSVEGDWERFVFSAIRQHSKYFPEEVVADISGNGNYDYDLPTRFVVGESSIKKIEYPQGDRVPTFIDEQSWMYYTDTSSTKIRFLDYTPATGETARVTFITPLNPYSLNITIQARDMLAYLAASLAEDSIATFYSQSTSNFIPEDGRDYTEQAEQFRLSAKAHRAIYNEHFGISDGTKPASGILDYDVPLEFGDPFTHNQKGNF